MGWIKRIKNYINLGSMFDPYYPKSKPIKYEDISL